MLGWVVVELRFWKQLLTGQILEGQKSLSWIWIECDWIQPSPLTHSLCECCACASKNTVRKVVICSFKAMSIALLTSAVVWPLFPNSEKWPYNCQGLQFQGRVHRTANPGSCMATFYKLRKVAIQLPRFAVLWQDFHNSEKRPYNCHR